MKTILIIVASIGVVLLLTEIVFKKTILKWKQDLDKVNNYYSKKYNKYDQPNNKKNK